MVATYAFFARSADEWRAIRKGCVDAGYPIWLIANIETGFKAYSDDLLQPYAGLFECAYYFALNGAAWNHKPLEQELRETAAFCNRHGATFMPCLWPGYYGAWLTDATASTNRSLGSTRCCAGMTARVCSTHSGCTSPLGTTTTRRRCRRDGSQQKNPAMVRAMSRESKGEPAAKEAEIAFAYLRETMVGRFSGSRRYGCRLPRRRNQGRRSSSERRRRGRRHCSRRAHSAKTGRNANGSFPRRSSRHRRCWCRSSRLRGGKDAHGQVAAGVSRDDLPQES